MHLKDTKSDYLRPDPVQPRGSGLHAEEGAEGREGGEGEVEEEEGRGGEQGAGQGTSCKELLGTRASQTF